MITGLSYSTPLNEVRCSRHAGRSRVGSAAISTPEKAQRAAAAGQIVASAPGCRAARDKNATTIAQHRAELDQHLRNTRPGAVETEQCGR